MSVFLDAAPLPLEGRGWGSIIGSLNHPLPSPPLKGEGAREPHHRGAAESPSVPEGGAEFRFGHRATLYGEAR